MSKIKGQSLVEKYGSGPIQNPRRRLQPKNLALTGSGNADIYRQQAAEIKQESVDQMKTEVDPLYIGGAGQEGTYRPVKVEFPENEEAG